MRDVPVNNLALTPSAIGYQLPVVQWIFEMECESSEQSIEKCAYQALLDIEKVAYTEPSMQASILSLSSRMQVLKGRLSSTNWFRIFQI